MILRLTLATVVNNVYVHVKTIEPDQNTYQNLMAVRVFKQVNL